MIESDHPEIIIYRADAVAMGFCYKGCRRFLKRHGWSWRSFLDNGISSKLLEGTGDAMAIKLVESARGIK